MGRNSNFPGKPSKLVTKKRVSVLIGNNHINSNSGIIGVSTASNGIGAQTITNNDTNNAHPNDFSVQSSNDNSELDSDIAIKSNVTNSTKCDVVQESISAKESHLDEAGGSNCQDDATTKKPTKKKVSFKFGLETSDDAHIVKKEPNITFAPPVSIIKKECLTRAIRIARGGESIIKPSVLSGLKILNNGANIDKLNSLTFKSQTSKFSNCKLSDNVQSEESAEDQSDIDGDEGRDKNGHNSSDEGSDEKNSPAKNENDSDTSHGVPKRSVHSSRIIKPNKRFGDESNSSLPKNGMGKKKSSKTELEGLNQPDIQKNEDEGNVLKVSEHIKNNPFARIGDDIFGSSKSLLRQSKLQFASSTLSSSTGNSTSKDNLFSTNATNANLNRNIIQLSNTVCCICGTAAPAAFTHKSRKYGNCCDSCNKYISKTVKKCCAKVDQLPPKILQCKKGDGNCFIAPIVPNIHHSFKAKKPCSACWLKKCIQSCRLTSEDRARVLKLLPVSMRNIESKSFTSTFQSRPETITADSTLNISTGLASLFGNSLASARRLVSPWTTNPKDGSETTEFRSFTSLSNPLSENNSKFGSSPQIVPNILEKSTIMTSGISASLPITVTLDKKSQEIEEHAKEPAKESVKEAVKESSMEISTQNIDSTTVTKQPLPQVAGTNVEQEETSRLRLRKKDKQENVSTTCVATPASLTATIAASAGSDTTKRQRIDLKGPRVKHVCRSASIVLGQPIATFGDENQILETLDTPPRPESPNGIVEFEGPIPSIAPNNECSDSTRLSPPATPINNDYDSESTLKDQSGAKSPSENSKSDDSSSASVDCHRRNDNDTKPVTRKLSRPNMITTNGGAPSVNNKKLNSFIRKPALKAAVKASPTISIDFWENYDPAEVSQHGFGLIFSEEVDIKALCFLCGSCGQDPLMFCVCCCEPYHEYCVEDKYNLKPHNSHDDTNASFMETSFLSGIGTSLISPVNKLNWLCPRCTTCYSCNMASGSKVKCQKCQKNYHPTCLGTSKRSSGADRPLICASCLKCKSCGTTKVSKFIGNMPMCTKCFESRQNGKYCPMCNKCYEENDFNIKMMECGACNKWVHAKCEGLSDEKYNMLSVLPENIEFICRICRGKKNPNDTNLNATNSMDQQITWEAAVAAELKNGLLSVVKQLSKSRQACALLKLSPRKKPSTCNYCTQNQSRVKRNENDFEEYIEDPFDFAASQANESNESNPLTSYSNKCFCIKTSTSSKPNTSQSLIDIKQKIIANELYSLADFNYDMNLIINAAACDELMTAYKEILSEAFPWFQNETKACTDALEEDMYDSCNFDQASMETNEIDQQVPMIDIPDDIDEYFYQPVPSNDTRQCMFCKSCGDGYPAQESRLLYCGQNSWVHANCAMWSAEVFEEIDGSLQNVHSAISRGRMIKCSECGNKGATVGCNLRNCGEHYHFPCARRANCAFMSDKTVFCPQHSNNDNCNSKAVRETNFEVLRPVYIELDRKRKRPVSPRKVQFLIGSLHVKQLGRFIPKLSDLSDAIVPAEFSCSRLYWSSKEPWKIVEYTIRTTVLSNFNIAMDMGRNFTVDHSLNLSKIQIGLAQITKWHSTLLNADDHENTILRFERNAKFVNGHGDETNEEEPQTNADLLPPEIKDAIFEDLPHDILDGISMLDILPKLMYEDMMAMDTKNESSLNADSLRDNETDDDMSQESHKGFDNDNNWTSTNMHAEDAMLSARSAAGALSRDVKRTKSELLGNRSHQRTTAWSNKIDTALSAKRSRLTMLMSFRKKNEERTNISEIKRQCKRSSEEIKDKSFTWSAAKRFTQLNNDMHPTDSDVAKNRFKISQLDGMDDFDGDSRAQKSLFKCDRCHYTCRNQDLFQRHLQSSCEQQSSMRDSNSKTPDVQQQQQQQSIQSNVILTSVNGQDYCNLPILQQNNQGQQIFGISGTNINQLAMQNSVQVNGQTLPLASIQNGSLPVQMQGMFINPNTGTIQTQQSHVFGQPLTLGAIQQQVFPIQNLQQNAANQGQTLSLQHATSQNIQYQPQIITCSSANTSQVLTVTPSQQQNIATSNYASIKSIQTQPTQMNRNTIILPQTDKNSPTKKQPIAKLQLSPGRTKGRLTTNCTPKTIQIKKSNQVIKTDSNKTMAHITNTSMTNIRPNGSTQLDNNNIIIQSTSTPSSNQPLIVQQVNAANQGNLLQYVTSDGSNNGLQYFTMPTNDFKPQQPTQYLTPNPLMPGTFQLQTDNGNLLLANTATGLQVIPNNAFSQQPQVIGTIIQPQATTIQCGMMSSEQMVLGGTPSFDLTNSLNGCMLLNSQPVYYGLETIVQNTVMQSQQFVSTAMQGVLSQNSSFSATTTQVFQASKIEPIMDMQQSYVVLNNDGTIMASQPQQPILTTTNLLQQAIPQLQNQTSQIQSTQNGGWRIIDDKSNVFTTNPTIIQTQPQTTTSCPQVHSNPMGVQPQAQQQHQSQIQPIPTVSPQVQLQKVQPHKQITKSRQPKQSVASKQTAKPSVKSSPIVVNEMQSQAFKSDMDSKPQIVVLKSAEAFNIQKPSENCLKNDGNRKTHLTTTSSHEMKISSKIHAPTSQYVNQRKVSSSTPVSNGTKISPVAVKPKIVGKGLHGEKSIAKQSNIQISMQKAIMSNPKSKSKVTTIETSQLGLTAQPIIKTNQSEAEIPLSPETPVIIIPTSTSPMNITMVGSANIKSNTSEIPEIESPKGSQNKCEPIVHSGSPTKSSTTPSVLDTSPKVSISSSVTNAFNSQSTTSQNSILANQVQINFPVSNCIQLPTAPYAPLHANGIPTNVVNPIQQYNHNGNRPMNRVLPMQTIQPKCSPTGIDSTESKSSVDIKSNLVKNLNDDQKSPLDSSFSSTSSLSSTPKLKIEEDPRMDEEMDIDEVNDFVNGNIEDNRQNTELKPEEMEAVINTVKDIDDSSNSTDFDSFKDSFLRGSSAEEVFDKLKKEEQINNSKSRPEEKICEIIMTDANERKNDCKIEPEDQSLFDLPNSSEDATTIVTNVMLNKTDEAQTVQSDEISNQKENIVPSASSTAISSSPKLLNQKMQKTNKEFVAPKISGPRLLYEIQSEDGFTYKSTSISEIWEKLFEAVQIARKAHGLSPLPIGPLADMCGYQMMGLKTNALKYLLEQLPGVERCSNYSPAYHKRAESTNSHASSSGYWSDCDEMKENVNGTARCESYKGRSEYDMFGWLASRHRKQPVQICIPQNGIDTEILVRRGSGSNLPMAMRYRTLKETYKDSVGVYRSHIHGRGLFCNRDIEAGEMVIEYAGELIRSTLTDKRERYYDSRGIGCYMFKIDDNLVVDATMRGNAARFINHSCEPNCYSKVVDILGHKHIIIFALRRIVQGEELTYDYKFPFEETKIPCSCGSRKCRKYLN